MKRILALLAALVALLALPAVPAGAVAPYQEPFERTWARTDQPVADNMAQRTWMWGPSALSAPMTEYYKDSIGHLREVQYFDKARMEVTKAYGNTTSPWYVTNGLLTKEMIAGQLQAGNKLFVEWTPAEVNVAGDLDDPDGPTYASFAGLLSAAPLAQDAPVVSRIARDGSVSEDPALAGYGVTANMFVTETNHRVASVFWQFMSSTAMVYEDGQYVDGGLFLNPYYATGYPISEAYWTTVRVGGTPKNVLMQVFERRVLTYTPDNPDGWKVEAGNVGQHYFLWRYGGTIPSEPPVVNGVVGEDILPVDASPYPFLDGTDRGGQISWTIGNQSPYPMVFTFEGPTTVTVELPACPECTVYSHEAFFRKCEEYIPRSQEILLPAGNYKVTVAWTEGNVIPASGPWTFVPDAQYGSCWAVIKNRIRPDGDSDGSTLSNLVTSYGVMR